MPKILLPFWVNRASAIYLAVLAFLILFGFYWTALAWYLLGGCTVEEYEVEIDEFEEEADEEEMTFFDIILEASKREKNVINDHSTLIEIFDSYLVEPFYEPNYNIPEGLDALLWTLNFYKQELEKTKLKK